MSNQALIEFPRCRLTRTGLSIDQSVSESEWTKIGQTLRTIEGSIQFWIGDWLRFGQGKGYVERGRYEKAEEITGLERKTLQNAAYVSGAIESSRRREDLSWSHHSEVAALPVREQERFLDRAEKQELSSRELRVEVRTARHKPAGNLPPGKFDVIYADPPWPVGSMVLDKWESPLDDKYPTMSLQEIKDLPVGELAAEDCSLFIWTTHTFLREAFDVISSWGFEYHCCITWDKGSGWSLSGFHRRTEFCLYAYRGKINVSQTGEFIPTIFAEKKGRHSQKPEKMYEFIEGHTPKKRIELFARIKREGWDIWGNEPDA